MDDGFPPGSATAGAACRGSGDPTGRPGQATQDATCHSHISCAVAISTLRNTGGCKVSMASTGGMGTVKVGIIRSMTADTGALRTDSVALCCTILIRSTTGTVIIGTIPQTAVSGRQLRIIMTVFTVGVCCTGRVMDIRHYIRTGMTCRRAVQRNGKPG